jgi:hypothetical protein
MLYKNLKKGINWQHHMQNYSRLRDFRLVAIVVYARHQKLGIAKSFRRAFVRMWWLDILLSCQVLMTFIRNTCNASVWNLLQVTHLAPRVL